MVGAEEPFEASASQASASASHCSQLTSSWPSIIKQTRTHASCQSQRAAGRAVRQPTSWVFVALQGPELELPLLPCQDTFWKEPVMVPLLLPLNL